MPKGELTMRNLFIDVASYQPDDLATFTKLARLGVKGAVVKLTEGSNPGSAYQNPKAANQLKHAQQVGMKISAYHFARYTSVADAKAEADWFIKVAQQLKLPLSTPMIVDAEVHSAPDYTAATKAFIQRVQQHGFTTTGLYAMKSFFTTKILDPTQFTNKWVAGFGVHDLGINDAVAWQFADRWHGMNQDISYDFTGLFTVEHKPTVPHAAIPKIYTVKAGDTLSQIAVQHHSSVARLVKQNQISDPNLIRVGQKIML